METYDLKSLQELLKDIHVLTKIKLCIYDSNENELCFYPKQFSDFCSELRRIPEMNQRCQECDRRAFSECKKNRSQHLYTCHAGLTEAVVPIVDKGGVIAYVMFGQIILKEKVNETREHIRKCHSELADEVEKIPIKSQRELNAAATVLQAITAYVMTNRWVVPNKSEFIREIDRYIEEHLSESITIKDICRDFRIGRTKLYELSMDYLSCGLAEYIRRQRIMHAQNMLIETDMPVTDVAFATGFYDYNHFSRIFKQTTGISAREYRKRK